MVLAVAFVTYPLLWPQPESPGGSLGPAGPLDDLLSQRDATYAGIREIEFEHELGNLSQLDYQLLREEYRRKAAGLLQEIDKTASAAPAPAISPDVELESAVKRLRERRGKATSSLSRCPLCREPVAAGDNHCTNCGAALARFCVGCGEAREPDDRFCRFCGRTQEARS
jgi:hypothetical protein